MLYSRVFSNRFHTSIERRDLTYWSKFNFRQALSYQLEAFPCEHGIDKPKSINNYRNQFAQLELNLRLIKKDRILATTEKQYLIYQYLMNEVHGIRSKQLLSPSIYVNDLCKNYLSSFDANKVKIFSKQFENQYFRWYSIDYSFDNWTKNMKTNTTNDIIGDVYDAKYANLSYFQYCKWYRYPYQCRGDESPFEIIIGYLYYLENQVNNDIIELVRVELLPYHKSDLPILILSSDLDKFKDWNLVFTNIDKIHYYTINQYFSIDPYYNNRFNNSIVDSHRVILTSKDNSLFSFLNHWEYTWRTLSKNYVKILRKNNRYVGSFLSICRRFPIQALGLGGLKLLSLLNDIEVIPGIKFQSFQEIKSYLSNLHLKNPIGFRIELNNTRLDSLIRWISHEHKLVIDGKSWQKKTDKKEIWINKIKTLWSESYDYLIDNWKINPFTLFIANFLMMTMNVYIISFFNWYQFLKMNLHAIKRDLRVIDSSIYTGYAINRSVPSRIIKAPNYQDQLYLNEIWSSIFYESIKEDIEFTGSDMIQNICDYYRENLFMQASGLDFYYGYRIKVKGNISVDWLRPNNNSDNPMDNIYNMANRKRHLTKDIAYYNKSKFQMQTLFWYPFNSLNFSNRNKEIFDDWYSDIDMSYRVIRIKIPNVFLRNIEVNDTYLDKDKIENYLKYESLSPEFKKQFEVYSQMKESQKDSESQEDSESDSSSDTNNQDNALSSEFINNKPELKLPDLSHLYLEDRLAYETSNHYGYKTFLQVQKRITGHRITKLIQYSELIGYLSNTLLFPFIEIEHKEGGSFDMICKYNYEILKGHSSGENYYHRSGLMKDTVSLVNISWESLKNRLMGNSTSIKNQIFLNYDSLAKELLPIDLQYLMKNQKGAGGQALEIRNNWTFQPIRRNFDIVLNTDSISSNVYDSPIMIGQKNMNIRLTEEGKYFEVHSFNRSQITLKVIFLLGKIKDFSFKLNFQLRLIGMDIGIDRLGKESNLKSAFINFLPFNFQPYTLTGNYLRFLGKSSAAKILVKIGDFGLIIRALTLSSIIDDKKAATNLSTLSNFNRKKWPIYWIWGDNYNGLGKNTSMFMYSMTESFNDYLNYTNSIGIDNSQLFLEIVETIISQDFDRAFLLKLKELLKGNMKNLFQFLVYNYPSYFIKKFLIPYFRPDIYFQYLNLFFSIEFKIFLNVNYKNVHFVQLFVILFEIPNNMVDEEGRIQVLTFSLDYLLWHYWYSEYENLNISFVEHKTNTVTDITQIDYKPSWSIKVMGLNYKDYKYSKIKGKWQQRINWRKAKFYNFLNNCKALIF